MSAPKPNEQGSRNVKPDKKETFTWLFKCHCHTVIARGTRLCHFFICRSIA